MKYKEFLIRQQEQMFEMELGYLEYLESNFTEPTEAEVTAMERDFNKSLTGGNRSIPLKPINNQNYYPVLGA